MYQYGIPQVGAVVSELYISGIRGLHPTHVAIPYFYRGHYLYDRHFTAVEPEVFSQDDIIRLRPAKQGAPPYNPTHPQLTHEMGLRAAFSAVEFEVDRILMAHNPIVLVNDADANTNGTPASTTDATNGTNGSRATVSAPPTTFGGGDSRNPTPRPGTARSAASTNQNVQVCVHGPDCPGKGTQDLTSKCRVKRGWADKFPAMTIPGHGIKMMLDWEAMLKEETDVRGGGTHPGV